MINKKSIVAVLGVSFMVLAPRTGTGQTGGRATLKVQKTTDFSVGEEGIASQWDKAEWTPIVQQAASRRMSRNPAPAPTDRKPPLQLTTRAKALYSDTGIYFLVECQDRVLQATMDEDFMQLWWEDVVEIFLWPDESEQTYFEYQISPLGYELILRITRDKRGGSSWRPFSYGGDKSTTHEIIVTGGKKESGASISRWTAEIFMPYALLHPAGNIPPERGARWRVNLYRFDYDTGDRDRWEWQPVEGSNHSIEQYGTFLFE